MKCTRLSAATARASRVLPVPGGPYKSTPFGARIPSRSKIREYFSGSSTISPNRADTSEEHRGPPSRSLLAIHNPEIGAFPDHNRPRRNRPHHLEIHRLG